jgi:hypothetical protein
MVNREERVKVLNMIEEGKISVEEGATLLKTLESPEAKQGFGRTQRNVSDRRQLRVRVDDAEGGRLKVNVVLPMALVNAGLNIASRFIDDVDSEHAAALMDAIEAGKTGKIVDVLDVDGDDHVQVFIE